MEISMASKQVDHQQLGIHQLWEVFTWLPAKEVIRSFSSLSKTAHSILSEPFFLEMQSVRSSLFDGGFFLQPEHTVCESSDKLEFHALPWNGDPPSPAFGIPDESLSFLRRSGRVTASSQGLVVLRGTDNELLICNPATKRWAPLPLPEWLKPRDIVKSGLLLECHPCNLKTDVDFASDYTVVVPVWVKIDDNSWGWYVHLAIYRNGMWERELCDVTVKGRELDLDTLVAIFRGREDGLVIHYLCRSLPNASRRPVYEEPYIVSYNTQRKAHSRRFKLPEGAWDQEDEYTGTYGKFKIFKWRPSDSETVCLVRIDNGYYFTSCGFTVWVLEDYERGVWRRVLKKTTVEMGVRDEEGGYVKGCCVVNNRILVFATNWHVYVYEMEGPNAGRLEVLADHDESRVVFTAYANTLRPVSTGTDISLIKEEEEEEEVWSRLDAFFLL